jgi:septum formation protein
MVWNNPDRRVILASQSPRRRDILRGLGFTFRTVRPSVKSEAAFLTGRPLKKGLAALALAKAASVAQREPGALVLGADTVVVVDGEAIGKPRGRREAGAMLRRLSGKTHAVHTSVALVCGGSGFSSVSVETTRVRFRKLAEWEIDAYLRLDEHADKAGAYAIQGRAMAFVDGIDGCYYNVVGLPVRKTIDLFAAYANRKGATNV